MGYDVDMGHILAKAIVDDPSKVEYVVQSSDSRIPNVLTDKVDITCQFMTVTAGRAQQVDFTIPYASGVATFIIAKNGTNPSMPMTGERLNLNDKAVADKPTRK